MTITCLLAALLLLTNHESLNISTDIRVDSGPGILKIKMLREVFH